MDNIKTPDELLIFMSNNLSYGFVGKNGKIYTDIFSDEWQNDWFEHAVEEERGIHEFKYQL